MQYSNMKNATTLITFGTIIFQFIMIMCLYEAVSTFKTTKITWILVTIVITWLGISIFTLYTQWETNVKSAWIITAVSGVITFFFVFYAWSYAKIVDELMNAEGIESDKEAIQNIINSGLYAF